MKLTIATITARHEPHLDWLLAELDKQALPGDEIELVLVDFYGRALSELAAPEWTAALADGGSPWLAEIIESRPKPNIWQGAYRLGPVDLHAIANARNTALALAGGPFVFFVDDRAHLGPRWLERARAAAGAAEAGIPPYALCGPCDKLKSGGGRGVISARDDRRRFGRNVAMDAPGDFLLGGNFGAPLAWMLEVGGHEEASDPIGWQDVILGRMLKNRGRRIVFDSTFEVTLDRVRSAGEPEHPFPRINKFTPGKPPGFDAANEAKRRFGRLQHTSDMTADLGELRTRIAAGAGWPIPDPATPRVDWYDGKPIAELIAMGASQAGVS